MKCSTPLSSLSPSLPLVPLSPRVPLSLAGRGLCLLRRTLETPVWCFLAGCFGREQMDAIMRGNMYDNRVPVETGKLQLPP